MPPDLQTELKERTRTVRSKRDKQIHELATQAGKVEKEFEDSVTQIRAKLEDVAAKRREALARA